MPAAAVKVFLVVDRDELGPADRRALRRHAARRARWRRWRALAARAPRSDAAGDEGAAWRAPALRRHLAGEITLRRRRGGAARPIPATMPSGSSPGFATNCRSSRWGDAESRQGWLAVRSRSPGATRTRGGACANSRRSRTGSWSRRSVRDKSVYLRMAKRIIASPNARNTDYLLRVIALIDGAARPRHSGIRHAIPRATFGKSRALEMRNIITKLLIVVVPSCAPPGMAEAIHIQAVRMGPLQEPFFNSLLR